MGMGTHNPSPHPKNGGKKTVDPVSPFHPPAPIYAYKFLITLDSGWVVQIGKNCYVLRNKNNIVECFLYVHICILLRHPVSRRPPLRPDTCL